MFEAVVPVSLTFTTCVGMNDALGKLLKVKLALAGGFAMLPLRAAISTAKFPAVPTYNIQPIVASLYIL